jgi:hypothetical protein
MINKVHSLWTTLTNTGIVDRRTGSGARQILFLNTIVLLVLILIVQNLLLAAIYYPDTMLLCLPTLHRRFSIGSVGRRMISFLAQWSCLFTPTGPAIRLKRRGSQGCWRRSQRIAKR